MGSGQVSGPVLFFHGFWGQASDWKFLNSSPAVQSLDRSSGRELKPSSDNHTEFQQAFLAIDYTQIEALGPQNDLSDWGQNFLNWKKSRFGSQKIKAVGYSQGGRLLLQAFEAAPDEFEKLVLISAHPGLQNLAAKEQRLESDRKWAQKFRTAAWDDLQKEWNSQGVFKGGRGEEPLRLEKDYDREVLALCFENWSLAHQQDFRTLILENLKKIAVVLGEEDSKYVQLYKSFLNDSQALKMEKGAAHRVPFDQPLQLVETLNSII